jgi:hypothetical protein
MWRIVFLVQNGGIFFENVASERAQTILRLVVLYGKYRTIVRSLNMPLIPKAFYFCEHAVTPEFYNSTFSFYDVSPSKKGLYPPNGGTRLFAANELLRTWCGYLAAR